MDSQPGTTRSHTSRPGVIALAFLLASVPNILLSDRLLLGSSMTWRPPQA